MSITPQDLQKLLDEREASRASRKRAWENLQEIRWVLKDVTGVDLPPPARKANDLEGGRVVKDGVRTALRDCQDALSEFRFGSGICPLSNSFLFVILGLEMLFQTFDPAPESL